MQSAAGGVARGAVVIDRVLTADEVTALRARFQKWFKVLQYLGLAAFAWFNLLLMRKVQRYYGAHLIWALHYYSFVYVLTGVVDKTHANPMVGIFAQIVYLMVAMRRLAGSGFNGCRRGLRVGCGADCAPAGAVRLTGSGTGAAGPNLLLVLALVSSR